jgi:hypothetical protein
MRGSAVGLAIMLGLAAGCGSAAQTAPAPALGSYLSCDSAATVHMIVDHAGLGTDSRTPEQMARDYSAVAGGSFSGKRKVVYRSAERKDIAFVDGQGRIRAVLSYGYYGLPGWRLDQGVNCP